MGVIKIRIDNLLNKIAESININKAIEINQELSYKKTKEINAYLSKIIDIIN